VALHAPRTTSTLPRLCERVSSHTDARRTVFGT
jgi:hypothetical protein